jgi:hypothetical protein
MAKRVAFWLERVGAAVLGAAAITASTLTPAHATNVPLGDAANYAVLYSGYSNNTLQITNVTVNGNIGVGNIGMATDSGPSTVNGSINFAAGNPNTLANNNVNDVITGGVHYGNTNINTDLANLSTLSSGLGALTGTNVAFTNSATQTINESSGQLETLNGVTYRVFDVTSVGDQAGQILTINGDGSGDPVIFNFASSANLQGDVTLDGLTADQVLYNFYGGANYNGSSGGTGGPTLSLNNNASSYPTLAWQGVLLDPNGSVSLVNANLDGSVYGGDSHDMQIVSGDTITAPANMSSVPEPTSLSLLGAGLVGMAFMRRRSRLRPTVRA